MKNKLFLSLVLMGGMIRAEKIDTSWVKDAQFWSKQYVEHAEFAAGFAKDAKLKSEGVALAGEVNAWSKKIAPVKTTQKEFGKISSKLKTYQAKVRTALKKETKTPDIKIQLDLLDHMDKETDYAQKKVNGKVLSKEEEAKFWSTEHEGEAKVISALMNPNGQQLKAQADNVATVLHKNDRPLAYAQLSVVEEANKKLDEIGKELDKNPTKTRVPAKLAKHEERERAYAQKIFNQLDR